MKPSVVITRSVVAACMVASALVFPGSEDHISGSAARAGDARARTIHMIIEAESSMSEAEIHDTFERARASTLECSVASCDIQPIGRDAYVVLKSILQGRPVPSNPKSEESGRDAGRCYLVTLKGVEGDEKAFYATLRDGKKMPNPLRNLEEVSRVAMAIGSFRDATVDQHPWKVGVDEIHLVFPNLGGGVEPKRMWMRFPLTKAEETALSKELDAKFAGDGFKSVPGWIRKNLLGEKLTPEGSTGWFQLEWNAEHQAFEKTLPIDTKSWQERLVNNKDFMGENAILIYEFEGEDGSQQIIKLDNGKYYRPFQVVGWLTGLPAASTAEKGGGKEVRQRAAATEPRLPGAGPVRLPDSGSRSP